MCPFLPPMFARSSLKLPPVGTGWAYEPLLDGVRVQLHRHGRDVEMFGRHGECLTRRFPFVTRWMQAIRSSDFVADGVLVPIDEVGRAASLLSLNAYRERDFVLLVFDVLKVGDYDARGRALWDRGIPLSSIAAWTGAGPKVFRVRQYGDGERLLALAGRFGFAGVVAKRLQSRYEEGLSADWVKVRCVSSATSCGRLGGVGRAA